MNLNTFMYTYLLINIFSVLVPFLASFHPRIQFYRQFKAYLPAMIISAAVFIGWDMLFTYWGVWGFNPVYITGIHIANLPLEEVLFFITIPYSCVFTYFVLNTLIKKDYAAPHTGKITVILAILTLLIAVFNFNKKYTFSTSALTFIAVLVFYFIIRPPYLGRLYFSWMILLIPFLIVNGILTGSFIDEEVVFYDDSQNLGIRLFTIPVEDSLFGLLLFMMNVGIYEFFRRPGKKVIPGIKIRWIREK